MLFSSDFKKVLPYALVVFLGYVGFSMPLPLLPEMFLNPEIGILQGIDSKQLKTFLLGLVMSSYPAGQLIGAPILGRFSDRWGRKKVILLSLMGCLLGYLITAVAVEIQKIFGIFLGLFFDGLS